MTDGPILLVEDELMIRELCVEILEHAGYAVVSAATGDEAIALIEGTQPFLALITDFHMPGQADGFAVAQRIRADHPKMPVVLMSGRPREMQVAWEEKRKFALEHFAFLKKPYGAAGLLGALAGVLGV